MLETKAVICLIIFVVTIILYALNKFPIGAIAMLSMAAMIISGCLEPSTALSNFGNANGIIMVCMFVIATGFGKTQMVNKISSGIAKLSANDFMKSMRLLIIVYFLTIPLINSGLARYIIFYPIIVATCEKFGKSPSNALYPFAMIGMMGLTRIPIGSTATLHLRNNAQIEAFGITEYAMTVTDYFKACTPGALIILAYCLIFAFKITPEQPIVPINRLEQKDGANKLALKPYQEIVGYAVFLAASLAIVFEKKIGVPAWVSVIIGVVILNLTGVLDSKEVQKAIPLRMLLVFVGSISIANAMSTSGAGDAVGNAIANALGGTKSTLLVYAILFIVSVLMTQVLQNNATIYTMIPISIMTAKALGGNPVGPVMLVTIACSCCIFTPMATASIAMVMDTGGYDLKSLFKQGIIPVIIYTIVNVLWVTWKYPLWA